MSPELWVSVAWKLAAGGFLILVNAFFVSTEMALVRIRSSQLENLAAQGNRNARRALRLKQNMSICIAAAQVGITLAGLGLGKSIEPLAEELVPPLLKAVGLEAQLWLGNVLEAMAFIFTTFTLIIVGEMVPKAVTLHKTLPMALAISTPMGWFVRVARPFTMLIDRTAGWILMQMGIVAQDEEGPHSEEELRLLFMATQKARPGSELGREIVLNSLDLRRRLVRDVMRPRNEIVGFSTLDSLEKCLEIAERTRYSRFPLSDAGNIDRTFGVVHFKDLVASFRAGGKTAAELTPVAKKLIYVPETSHLEKLLSLFLERRLHFAIVVDEYGGTTGIVTLENCLEELVGQIQDEHDQEHPRLVKKSDVEWELDGLMPLFELSELVGQLVMGEGVNTVGGWLTQHLGGFPKRGDTVILAGHELKVLDLEGLRVARVGLKRLAAPTLSMDSDTAWMVKAESSDSRKPKGTSNG